MQTFEYITTNSELATFLFKKGYKTVESTVIDCNNCWKFTVAWELRFTFKRDKKLYFTV